MVERMQVATRGLIVGYSLIFAGWASVFALLRFGPDLGKFAFAIFAAIIIAISHAVALAILSGSLICAVRALHAERASRTAGGYLVLAASTAPAGVLALLYLRVFVVGH